MTIISDKWTKSIISTFSGEKYGSNINNILFPILDSCQELNMTQRSLSINGSKIKIFQDNKVVYCCFLTSKTMSMKQIQILFVSIKPREDLNHHQVVNLTLKCKRWNQTTEKLIPPRFRFLDAMRIDNLPNVCSLLIVLIQQE